MTVEWSGRAARLVDERLAFGGFASRDQQWTPADILDALAGIDGSRG